MNSSSTTRWPWPMVECSTEASFFDATGDLECARLVGHGRTRCHKMYSFQGNKSSALSKLSCVCDLVFMNHNDGSPEAVSELDPRAGCDHLSSRGIAGTVSAVLNIAGSVYALAYAISTLWMIRQRMTRSQGRWHQRWCWWVQNKMAFVASTCVAANLSLIIFRWFYTPMVVLMRSTYPWYPATWVHTILPTVLFEILALTSVSLQWVQVAQKAKSFRRHHTSKAAQRRAWLFVLSVVLFTLTQVCVCLFILNSPSICVGLLLVTIVVISSTYLIAARRLIALMDAAASTTTGSEAGSTSSASATTTSSSSRTASPRKAFSRTGQRLAKHGKKVYLIWITARRLVFATIVFGIGVVISVIGMVLKRPNDGEWVLRGRQTSVFYSSYIGDLLWIGAMPTANHFLILYIRRGMGRHEPRRQTASVVPTSGGDDCLDVSA